MSHLYVNGICFLVPEQNSGCGSEDEGLWGSKRISSSI